jgi:hypothetical protein
MSNKNLISTLPIKHLVTSESSHKLGVFGLLMETDADPMGKLASEKRIPWLLSNQVSMSNIMSCKSLLECTEFIHIISHTIIQDLSKSVDNVSGTII